MPVTVARREGYRHNKRVDGGRSMARSSRNLPEYRQWGSGKKPKKDNKWGDRLQPESQKTSDNKEEGKTRKKKNNVTGGRKGKQIPMRTGIFKSRRGKKQEKWATGKEKELKLVKKKRCE